MRIYISKAKDKCGWHKRFAWHPRWIGDPVYREFNQTFDRMRMKG